MSAIASAVIRVCVGTYGALGRRRSLVDAAYGFTISLTPFLRCARASGLRTTRAGEGAVVDEHDEGRGLVFIRTTAGIWGVDVKPAA
jgi:hypothetical protein